MYTVYIHMNHHCLSNHDYTYSSPKIESKQLDTWEWTGRNHHHNPLPFLETYFSIRSPWVSHYIQIHSDFRSINRHENTSFPLGPPAHPGPGAALRLHWWSPQGHGSRQFFIIWCPPGAPDCRTTAAPACSSRGHHQVLWSSLLPQVLPRGPDLGDLHRAPQRKKVWAVGLFLGPKCWMVRGESLKLPEQISDIRCFSSVYST